MKGDVNDVDRLGPRRSFYLDEISTVGCSTQDIHARVQSADTEGGLKDGRYVRFHQLLRLTNRAEEVRVIYLNTIRKLLGGQMANLITLFEYPLLSGRNGRR